MKKLILMVAFLFTTAANATVIDFEELAYGQTVAYDTYVSQGLLLDSSIDWGIYNSSSYPHSLINNTTWAGDLIGSFTSNVSEVSILMGDVCCDVDSGLLEVYDINGNLLASDYATDTSWFTVSVATNNIASFRVFATGAVVYDEIAFTASVTESASLLLLALGLVGFGFTRRTRKS